MPEGPSIVILKEEAKPFTGKKVIDATGDPRLDISRMLNKKVISFKSWGKHFLICFNDFFVRIHFLLFGSYRINERRDFEPRLSLRFKTGELNFYTNSIRIIEGSPDDIYDWEADVMSDEWNPKKAELKLKENRDTLACDALMDQDTFSGVGNIIKNEVLFRVKVHPEAKTGDLPLKKLRELIKQAAEYSWDFYNWKKVGQLKRNWLIYKKKICPRCHIPVSVRETGKTKRLSHFCNNCQLLYH